MHAAFIQCDLAFIQNFLLTPEISPGLTRLTESIHFIVRSRLPARLFSSQVIFLSSHLAVGLTYFQVLFFIFLFFLPFKLSTIQVVFILSYLPFRSSFCELIFLLGRPHFRLSSFFFYMSNHLSFRVFSCQVVFLSVCFLVRSSSCIVCYSLLWHRYGWAWFKTHFKANPM